MADITIKWIKARDYYEILNKIINLDEILKQDEVNGSLYIYSPALEEFLDLHLKPEKIKSILAELKPELEKELKETEEKLFEMLKDEKELQEIMQKPYEDDEYVFEIIDEVLNNEN